jgi:hypothetical protein
MLNEEPHVIPPTPRTRDRGRPVAHDACPKVLGSLESIPGISEQLAQVARVEDDRIALALLPCFDLML